jgi:hypothetical protein
VPSASRPKVSTPMRSIYAVWPSFISLQVGKRTMRHCACSTARASSTWILHPPTAEPPLATSMPRAKAGFQLRRTRLPRLAQRAVELGKDDAIALAASGFVLAFVVRDLGVGSSLIDRALVLNSNLAEAWNFGGWVKNFLGEPEAALERFARAMRLSPLDPSLLIMRAGTAHAYFFLGRYDEASSWAAMALQDKSGLSRWITDRCREQCNGRTAGANT